MFALLAGVPVASADRNLFQTAYAPAQQYAEMPQYVMEYPQAYPQMYVEEAYAEDNSTSWSWVAFCGAAGAAVGMAARTMFASNSSPAESDLEAGMYNQRMAMLAVGGEEATATELSEKSARILE